MLIEPNSYLYTYVVTRDFGFAPNPFHGLCTLATCKPGIRKAAQVGDWVLGVGGSKLKQARGKCIYLMKISEKISFQEYWNDERFLLKIPSRNGSMVKMIGDNIYRRDCDGEWVQEDSHHSNADGTENIENIERDTGKTDKVLISNLFLYFGARAITLDVDSYGYKGGIGFKKTRLSDSLDATKLISETVKEKRSELNLVASDPCQFTTSYKRVDQGSGKIS